MLWVLFLVLNLIHSSAPIKYILYVKTADVKHAGNGSNGMFVRVFGEKGVTPYSKELDNRGSDFGRDEADTYTFHFNDVGKILCVEFKTDGSDNCLLHSAYIRYESDSSWTYIRNKNNEWISRDHGEGRTTRKWCVDDCMLQLPISTDTWTFRQTDYEWDSTISNSEDNVIESHPVDATDSTTDIESEYLIDTFISDDMEYKIDTANTGLFNAQKYTFTENPPTKKGWWDGDQFDFKVNVIKNNGEQYKRYKGCKAPMGKKKTCVSSTTITTLEIKFSQQWQSKKDSSCRWRLAGKFVRKSESGIKTTETVE